MTAFGLTAAQLAEAFPFHFVVDRDLRILQVGPAWARVVPGVRPGTAAADVFRLQRPAGPMTYAALAGRLGSLLIVECADGGLPLRGELMATTDGALVFLGSPVIREEADLARFHLSVSDWPAHDSAGDYVFLLRGKDISLREARELTAQLARQRDALERALASARDENLARRQSERRAQVVLNTALDAVITIDGAGRVTFFNEQAERTFGWTREEAIGRSLASLIIPESQRQAHTLGMARYRETGEGPVIGRRIEVTAQHRNGRQFPVELSITPTPVDGGTDFSAFLRDVSAERQAERLLRAQSEAARLLATAPSLAAVARTLLEEVGRHLGSPCGAIWLKDRRSVPRTGEPAPIESLRCLAAWSDADLESTPFMAQTRTLTFQPNTGFPGATLNAGHPLVMDVDLWNQDYPRGAAARDAGLRWAIAVPLTGESTPFGTIEFFSRTHDWPAPDALNALAAIGGHLSQFIMRERSERSLAAEQQRLALALEASSLGTWSRYAASGIGSVDGRSLRMLGYEEGEADTSLSAWGRLIHPDDIPRLQQAFSAHESGATQSFDCEFRARHRLGHWVWILTRARIIERDETGAPVRVAGTFLDITERKRAEDLQRRNDVRIRAMIDNLLEGLFILDGQHRIQQANRTLARMLGYDDAQLPGLSIGEVLPGSLTPDGTALSDAYSQSFGQVAEQVARRRDGTLLPVEVRLYDVETPDTPLVAGYVRNLQPVQQADRLKKQFVASVSHELRTPLTAIRGAIGLLSGGAVGQLPPEARPVLAVAERNIDRLRTLIGDLLDFERIQSGLLTVDMTEVSLDAIMRGALDQVGALADEGGVRLEMEPSGLTVRADETRLTQVLVNLLSNAIKFSPGGSRVHVDAQRRNADVEVRVRDQGRGVPEELRELIFEPFRQVEQSDSRRHRGAGLGLAICRALVGQHGGRIGVTPNPAGGSTFWFTIPRTIQEPEHG